MKAISIFGLLILILCTIGCTTQTPTPLPILATIVAPTILPATPQPQSVPTIVAPTLAPPTLIPATAAPQIELGETITYRDEFAGFEFDYPANWNVTPIAEEAKANAYIYSATFFSFTRTVPSAEGIPEGETKIDVGVFKNDAASAQAALELRKQEFAGSDLEQKILREEMWTLPSGMQAARIQVHDRFGESAEMLTTINGRTILFGGVDDYELFDAIARTLRPF